MTEHPYKPQPWRLTDYYPEAYARFMDILNDGIILDWNDDDHDRHEAEFLADLAAHDAELREQIVRELVDEAQAMTRSSAHLLGGSSEKNAAYRMGICDGLTGAARITRGEKP